MTANNEVHQRDPKSLKNHLLNLKLYGEHIDESFVESIRQNGIAVPLEVCQSSDPLLNDVIITGRRRRVAAMTVGLKTVPCIYRMTDDHLEVERLLILDNVRNETTVEERVRMYEELVRIESEMAERRQKIGRGPDASGGRGNKKNLGAQSPQGLESTKIGIPREPRAKDTAADQVGIGRKTADKAAGVVHAADELRESGETEKANEIIETLNTKSVAAAVRMVEEAKAPPHQPDTEDSRHSRDIDRLTAKIAGSLAAAEKAAGELFVAIDQKKKTSTAFANRHTKFANMIRKFSELLEPCQHHSGIIQKSWCDTKQQVDS